MSDSCGYIVLDHKKGRIITAFRGTYSISSTIVDLSTMPQEYVPYPGDPEEEPKRKSFFHFEPRPWRWFRRTKHKAHSASDGQENVDEEKGPKCTNCTVHSGFFTSWKNTRHYVIPPVKRARETYPNYNLHLVGHSLGGAVAALAGLEFEIQGFNPTVTTFGEPRIGNSGLRTYLDDVFELHGVVPLQGRYRRVTHVDDPVPLLPLTEWGFRMHGGEIYISKAPLQPSVLDLRRCVGDQDLDCIYGAEADGASGAALTLTVESMLGLEDPEQLDSFALEDMLAYDNDLASEEEAKRQFQTERWGFPIPARYRMWQLLFAHRDYFWRLGLCVPGGDPLDWKRQPYPGVGDEDGHVEGDPEEDL